MTQNIAIPSETHDMAIQLAHPVLPVAVLDRKSIIGLVQSGLQRKSISVPERYHDAIGFLRVKVDFPLVKAAYKKKKQLEILCMKLALIPSMLFFASFLNFALSDPQLDKDIISSKIFVAVISSFFTFLLWIAIAITMDTFLMPRIFLGEKLDGIKNSGWDLGMLKACQRMSALGMTLPPPLLALVPYMHDDKVSTTVMSALGEEDAVSMFMLTETLEKVATDAERKKRDLLPVQQLTLSGDSSELLDRVGNVLEINDSKHKQVDFVV